jgi:hypothetical protein
METSAKSTEPTSSPLTSSVAGSRVSLFPTLDADGVRKMTASSGRRCFDSYVRLSRPTSWVKTFLGSLLTTEGFYSPLSSLTWRLRGSKSRRLLYFRLVPSVPYIDGIGSGFVPTPDTTTGAPNSGSNKRNGPKSLTEYAELLPTPTASNTKAVHMRSEGRPPRSYLPTPTVSMLKGASVGALTRKDGRSISNDRLDYAVLAAQLETTRDGLIPTPVSSDTGSRKHRYSQGGLALSDSVGGQLNPPWVEWLMGFPIGWTDLGPSETP